MDEQHFAVGLELARLVAMGFSMGQLKKETKFDNKKPQLHVGWFAMC